LQGLKSRIEVTRGIPVCCDKKMEVVAWRLSLSRNSGGTQGQVLVIVFWLTDKTTLVSRDLSALEGVAREIEGLGRKALPVSADLRNLEKLQKVAQGALSM
jgi:hypothetical protein